MNLQSSITSLNKVGKVLAKRLSRLGIETVRDLLIYYPLRYEDFSTVTDIQALHDGLQTTVRGRIELIANKRSQRKRVNITEAVVADETGQMRMVWFGQPFIIKNLKVGDEVFLSGKVEGDMFGVTMKGPSYEKVRSGTLDSGIGTHTARIVPMYSLTSGITQKQIRFLIEQVIGLVDELEDWVPDDLIEKADVMMLAEAVKAIHYPESQDELNYAERRLKFDELFVIQLRAEMVRQALKRVKAPKIDFQEEEIKAFVAGLPFELTKDQRVASWEILKDIDREEPMNRLLEGDVGSGKTVVAAMVAFNVLLNGYQVMIMAPTSILAAQHFDSLTTLLPDRKIVMVTREKISTHRTSIFGENMKSEIRDQTKVAKRREVICSLEDGQAEIVIGTHALLSDDVQCKNLGLVIVDEQHRFGVDQRKKIKEQSGDASRTPHFLSMTATPIPRSFALALYGDLDISVIKEMPKGRKPVKTRVVEPKHREKAYAFIRDQVRQGRQVFVVCPLIDDNEQRTTNNEQATVASEKKTVLSEYEKLSKDVFSELKVGFLHGKLTANEKDETMKLFVTGAIDLLVSTSVIEVGVDIPNASVMMIEGADRFGLAQLHQFRGRVGRAEHQSYCFLFTDSDTEKVMKRLEYFEEHNSGFDVAEFDLEQRGPGEVYGKTQSGMMQLRLARLSDVEIIKKAREIARGIDFEKYPGLKERVGEWEQGVHLE